MHGAKKGLILLFLGLCSTASFAYSALPQYIEPPGEKVIIVDPRLHAWGAYSANGELMRSGLASAGANWCKDIQSPCRTHEGVFRVYYLGDSSCYSTRFPLPNGGAPMPYCMYFNGNQALHGYPSVTSTNRSHGCVRMRTSDARWLRYNFVDGPNESNNFQGTLVMIRPY